MKKHLIFSCLVLFGITNLFAQQGVNTSGGEATGAGGSISYTIGQTDFITATGAGGIITQGIQQPYQVTIGTGFEETGIQLTASVYPNPTADFVLLKVENKTLDAFTFQLCDIQGKILLNKKIENHETSISMADLADATYFVNVCNNNLEVKTFKIIKN